MSYSDRKAAALTLVELVLVLSLVGIFAVLSVRIVFSGARTFMFVPRQELATQSGMEAAQAALERFPSSRSGVGLLPGLRLAARQMAFPAAAVPVPEQPAMWLAEANRVGFLVPNDPTTTADNQYVLIRLDSEQLKRSVYAALPSPCPGFSIGAEEVLPYYSAGTVRIIAGGQPVFRYYNQSGVELTPPGCSGASAIRRVDIAFTSQTGNGSFDQSQASVAVQSSVAIRFP